MMDLPHVLSDAQALPTRTDIERGFKGLAFGVLHSLGRASELGFSARVGPAVGPDYAMELDEVGTALSSGGSMPREWQAGFYFNSALVRIAAGSHRALRVLFAPTKDRFKDLADRAVREGKVAESDIHLLRAVYEDVNGFKHDGNAPLLQSRKIETLEQALGAAGQLLALIGKRSDIRLQPTAAGVIPSRRG